MDQPFLLIFCTYDLLRGAEKALFLNEPVGRSALTVSSNQAKHDTKFTKRVYTRIVAQIERLKSCISRQKSPRLAYTLKSCLDGSRDIFDVGSSRRVPSEHQGFPAIDHQLQSFLDPETRVHAQTTLAEAIYHCDLALITYLLTQNFQLLTRSLPRPESSLNQLLPLLEILPGRLQSHQARCEGRLNGDFGEHSIQLLVAEQLRQLPRELLRDSCLKLEGQFLPPLTTKPLGHQFQDIGIHGSNQVHLGDIHFHYGPNLPTSAEVISPLASLATEVDEIQKSILEFLHFTDLGLRQAAIVEAHKDTLDWIFESTHLRSEDTRAFDQWLIHPHPDSGIFWISGKAGSGKSTLMKHLVTSNLQQRYEGAIVAVHYFWATGTNLQKSLVGCLRTLLHRLYTETPDLILATLPINRWIELVCGVRAECASLWRDDQRLLQDLTASFLYAISQRQNVLIFIDALDECDASEEEMLEFLEFLKALSRFDSIKICLSSRPDNVFVHKLSEYDRLRLEHRNQAAIWKFTFDKLKADQQFRAVEQYENASANAIADLVASRSSGVFLWVTIVVRDLLKAVRDGESSETLKLYLNRIPAELDVLFERMLEKIKPSYRKDSAALLQIVLYFFELNNTSAKPSDSWERSMENMDVFDIRYFSADPEFALQPNFAPDFPEKIAHLRHVTERATLFLNSRSMGLLEFVADETMRYPRVAFVHRSVAEFLSGKSAQQAMYAYTDGPFNVRLWRASCHIQRLCSMQHYYTNFRSDIAGNFRSFKQSLSHICHELQEGILADTRFSSLAIDVLEKRFSSTENLFNALEWYFLRGRYLNVLNQDLSQMFKSNQQPGDKFLALVTLLGVSRCYIRQCLTVEIVQRKRGLSYLDYVLFNKWRSICDGETFYLPDIDLLLTVLNAGASPNQLTYLGSSPWLRFLLCRDFTMIRNPSVFTSTFHTLITHGASLSFTPQEVANAPVVAKFLPNNITELQQPLSQQVLDLINSGRLRNLATQVIAELHPYLIRDTIRAAISVRRGETDTQLMAA